MSDANRKPPMDAAESKTLRMRTLWIILSPISIAEYPGERQTRNKFECPNRRTGRVMHAPLLHASPGDPLIYHLSQAKIAPVMGNQISYQDEPLRGYLRRPCKRLSGFRTGIEQQEPRP